jgi:hypothetical protein
MKDVGNGAHHESAAEGWDTLVESTDPDPLDLSRDQVHMEGETVVVTRRVDPNAFPSWCRSLKGIVSPASLSYTFSFSREGVRSTIKGVWFSVQINVPSTPAVVVTRKVDPERGKSTVNGENRMLMEVVDPEPLTGDHVPFRKETGKSEFMDCLTLHMDLVPCQI